VGQCHELELRLLASQSVCLAYFSPLCNNKFAMLPCKENSLHVFVEGKKYSVRNLPITVQKVPDVTTSKLWISVRNRQFITPKGLQIAFSSISKS